MDSFKEIHADIRSLTPIIRKYLPTVHTIPLDKGLSWVPTWKSTPNDDRMFDRNAVPNIFTSLKYEVASFARDVRFVHSLPDGVFSPGILFAKGTLWPFNYKWNTQVANKDFTLYETPPYGVGHVFNDLANAYEGRYLRPGRIAQVIEGGGKRRLFAIGNYVKQRLLRPVHDWAMEVLASIPMDGTFNQGGPIDRLCRWASTQGDRRSLKVYSFDLKSATDRFPLSIIHEVTSAFFGPTVASCIVNGTFGLNSFDITSLLQPRLKWKSFQSLSKRKPVLVSFVQGQPLGYYTSCALFSLSHHYLVWLAAERSSPDRGRFTRYALLGDDIVIADEGVAREYKRILEELRVTISVPKSLVSDNGSFEFAKRFVVNFEKDLSPISLKALLSVRTTLGLCQLADKYDIRNDSTLFRLAGAGFRARARLRSTTSCGRRWQRLWVAAHKPLRNSQLPLEWWIGRGTPLNPYLKGIMVDWLRKELKPKQ
ncbi:hypothetical protein BC332_29277 [Capsicum chinense]|uniref:RNA-dependent RNA polymerase n=2 Tax=Capsicum annuum TaxID=4072 RepID=A0A075VX77_CAPAN|nr:hypothetical protein [Capsicum annuum]YP_009049730.1 hypothetical protein [Capsicum annuum]PHT96687.1 hypothetical protein BC332_34388 [Capsicum chinense]QFV19562.1 hypothetical protein [Capsicum annuum var. glabriusculum]AIG90072.1 hypothetical protein [Capsicum annuum]AIG90088.1 hypothetical protein [Capsicum annuum]PHT78704.1 hypothetical protein T459_16756 [Capsicum annuum]